MARLGARMATGLLQPLAVLGTLDKHVCLIIRVTLPATRQNLALLRISGMGSYHSPQNSADRRNVCCKRIQEALLYICIACREAARIWSITVVLHSCDQWSFWVAHTRTCLGQCSLVDTMKHQCNNAMLCHDMPCCHLQLTVPWAYMPTQQASLTG